MRASAWVLLLLAFGCGGAPAPSSAAPTGSDDRGAGGDNDPPLVLRVRPRPGARYLLRSTVTTDANGTTLTTEAIGETWAESVDPASRNTVLVSTVRLFQTRDAAGRAVPLPGVGSFDLTGVTFRRTVSELGATIGPVEVAGTSAANASFADRLRAIFEQSSVVFPETPVRAGDAWSQHHTLRVPIEGATIDLECDTAYRMLGTEGSGPTAAAQLAVQTTCRTAGPPTGTGGMQIDSRSEGTTFISIDDGVAGVSDMRTEMTTVLHVPGRAEPIVIRLAHHQHMVTSPIVE